MRRIWQMFRGISWDLQHKLFPNMTEIINLETGEVTTRLGRIFSQRRNGPWVYLTGKHIGSAVKRRAS